MSQVPASILTYGRVTADAGGGLYAVAFVTDGMQTVAPLPFASAPAIGQRVIVGREFNRYFVIETGGAGNRQFGRIISADGGTVVTAGGALLRTPAFQVSYTVRPQGASEDGSHDLSGLVPISRAFYDIAITPASEGSTCELIDVPTLPIGGTTKMILWVIGEAPRTDDCA